jgi:hypothetical protein
MLGSAAFRTDKWETAVKAFRYCTNLDPEVSCISFHLFPFTYYIKFFTKLESRNLE